MKLLLTSLVIISASHLNAPEKSAQEEKYFWLSLPEFNCLKTTDDGEDEIYFVTVGKYSHGGQILQNSKVISMNDGNRSNSLIKRDIVSFKLKGQESIDLVCVIMENDDFPREECKALPQKIASYLETRNKNLIDISSADIKTVLDRVNGSYGNSDDWIGAFKLHVSAEGTVTKHQTLNNPNGLSYGASITPPYSLRFDGDGSDYRGFLKIIRCKSRLSCSLVRTNN